MIELPTQISFRVLQDTTGQWRLALQCPVLQKGSGVKVRCVLHPQSLGADNRSSVRTEVDSIEVSWEEYKSAKIVTYTLGEIK